MNGAMQLHENAIQAAVHWIEMTLVGSVASAMAVIAVAWFGLMMLNGRLSPRRGVQLVLGCFIIFGASTIASGIMRSSTSFDGPPGPAVPPPAPILVDSMPHQPVPAPRAYDPYAGAALPPSNARAAFPTRP